MVEEPPGLCSKFGHPRNGSVWGCPLHAHAGQTRKGSGHTLVSRQLGGIALSTCT